MNTDTIATALFSALMLAVFMFLGSVAGAFFGGISGWIVGIIFDETFIDLRKHFGLSNLSMWQIGCGCGFVGAFFRTFCRSS